MICSETAAFFRHLFFRTETSDSVYIWVHSGFSILDIVNTVCLLSCPFFMVLLSRFINLCCIAKVFEIQKGRHNETGSGN